MRCDLDSSRSDPGKVLAVVCELGVDSSIPFLPIPRSSGLCADRQCLSTVRARGRTLDGEREATGMPSNVRDDLVCLSHLRWH